MATNPTCRPAGPTQALPVSASRCTCGAELTPVPSATLADDWDYVDAQGRTSVPIGPPGYEGDPWGYLTWLVTSSAWPGSAQAYSSLACALGVGFAHWTHHHRPVRTRGAEGEPAPLPFCCARPMRATPLGWSCRESGRMFPYLSHVDNQQVTWQSSSHREERARE